MRRRSRPALALDLVPFSLRDTVEDAVKLFDRARRRKTARAGVPILPDVPDALVGDPGRLRQVLVNLVGNAIKFTSAGDVVVEVAADSVSEREAVLRFTVSDTGIGIPPDKQWQIFGAFVQADASTTREFGGTGLGLTISAQLVEMMGGRIWVTSEAGKGQPVPFRRAFRRAGASDAPPAQFRGDLRRPPRARRRRQRHEPDDPPGLLMAWRMSRPSPTARRPRSTR